jgi:hypothetical protein
MFRVFARAHPQIRITPINAEPAVAQVIRRVVPEGSPHQGLAPNS